MILKLNFCCYRRNTWTHFHCEISYADYTLDSYPVSLTSIVITTVIILEHIYTYTCISKHMYTHTHKDTWIMVLKNKNGHTLYVVYTILVCSKKAMTSISCSLVYL